MSTPDDLKKMESKLDVIVDHLDRKYYNQGGLSKTGYHDPIPRDDQMREITQMMNSRIPAIVRLLGDLDYQIMNGGLRQYFDNEYHTSVGGLYGRDEHKPEMLIQLSELLFDEIVESNTKARLNPETPDNTETLRHLQSFVHEVIRSFDLESPDNHFVIEEDEDNEEYDSCDEYRLSEDALSAMNSLSSYYFREGREKIITELYEHCQPMIQKLERHHTHDPSAPSL